MHERELKFLCHKCGFFFRSVIELNQHKLYHCQINNRYQCSKFGFRAANNEALIQHDKHKHSIWSCDFCDYETNDESSLSFHEQMAHNGNLLVYHCEKCDRSFKNSTELGEHLKTHRFEPQRRQVLQAS